MHYFMVGAEVTLGVLACLFCWKFMVAMLEVLSEILYERLCNRIITELITRLMWFLICHILNISQ